MPSLFSRVLFTNIRYGTVSKGNAYCTFAIFPDFNAVS